jgi:predicted phosphodiesterase
MPERIAWIHISDLHFRIGQSEWAQNVVARDLLQDLGHRVHDWPALRFAVISGDLAFSGDVQEYRLVGEFLDEFRNVSGLARERLFIVPGNHDVIRSVKKTCYVGARAMLTSSQEVDQFLGDPPERESLLERQGHFRSFDREFHRGVNRTLTPDELGYVASLDVDGFPIAVAGLNSAWLCGGDDDCGHILVGERQAIDSLQILDGAQSNLVIGLLHHPVSWLCDFDQAPLLARFVRRCDFLHRGHLHEPHVSLVRNLSGETCVVVGAGATYSGRHFRNSYSVVILDLSQSVASVHSYGYADSQFQEQQPQKVPFKLKGRLPGTSQELAAEIAAIVPACPAPDYLAALVWERKTEIPIPVPGGTVSFGASALLDQVEPGHAGVARSFLQLRNLLRVNPGGGLRPCLARCRGRIEAYAQLLTALAHSSPEFDALLRQQNEQARALCSHDGSHAKVFRHACQLMDQLEQDGDWEELELTSRRYLVSPDLSITTHARRMLGRCLVRYTDLTRLKEGAGILEALARSEAGLAPDLLLACAALYRLDDFLHTKNLLTLGLTKFPDAIPDLKRLGHNLVMATGDAQLRATLDRL